MPQTPNHGYNVPNEGATDWHVPLNQNFEQYDTDIEIRDTDGNQGNYDPKADAKFLATDTGDVYIGDGSNWNHLQTSGLTPTLDQLNPGNQFLGVGRGGPVTGAEYFGVEAPSGSSSFGGMYINTDAGGWPFYGYAAGGSAKAWHYYDPSDSTWKLNNGERNLSVDSSGRVGIGTESPSTPLDVRGQSNWDLDNSDGDLRIGNDDYRLAIGVALGGGGAGAVNMRAKGGVNKMNLGAGNTNVLSIDGPNRGVGIGTTTASGSGQHGVGLHIDKSEPTISLDASSGNQGVIEFLEDGSLRSLIQYDGGAGVSVTRNLSVGNNVQVGGDLDVDGSKNFVQTVDTRDGEKEVVYTSTEAPTPRTEASGVAELEDGQAVIILPDHFGWVTSDDEPLHVQTTPYSGDSNGMAVVERSTDRLVIEDLDGEGDYEFAYTVKGTRKGYADKEVVREPSPEAAEPQLATPADD